VESYKCNFLGLSPKIHIPTHVNASEKFLLIDVFAPKNNGESPDPDPLSNYTFQFASPVTLDKGKMLCFCDHVCFIGEVLETNQCMFVYH